MEAPALCPIIIEMKSTPIPHSFPPLISVRPPVSGVVSSRENEPRIDTFDFQPNDGSPVFPFTVINIGDTKFLAGRIARAEFPFGTKVMRLMLLDGEAFSQPLTAVAAG